MFVRVTKADEREGDELGWLGGQIQRQGRVTTVRTDEQGARQTFLKTVLGSDGEELLERVEAEPTLFTQRAFAAVGFEENSTVVGVTPAVARKQTLSAQRPLARARAAVCSDPRPFLPGSVS